jgi:hypothetical protein
MPEIGTSGSMSGDGKRGVAAWPKPPRPSSTLPESRCIGVPDLRKLFCENDLNGFEGAPRCRHSVAQVWWNLHALKAGP